MKSYSPTFGTKLALYFVLFGIPWILVGDYVVGESLDPLSTPSVQTLKGLLFVVISAGFIKFISDNLSQELVKVSRREKQLQNMLESAEFLGKMGSWRRREGSHRGIISRSLLQILGHSTAEDEDIEELLTQAVHTEDRERVIAARKAWREAGGKFSCRYRIVTKGGKIKWLEEVAETTQPENGNGKIEIGKIIDVTKEIEAREEADQKQATLQSIMASIGDGFLTLDEEWRCIFVNQYALDMLHLKRDEFEGKLFWDVFPKAQGHWFERHVLEALETGDSRRFEVYVESMRKWFDIHAHPTSQGIAIYFSDISEQRKTQGWLELLEKAVIHLNDMVMIGKDTPDGVEIKFVNSAFEKTLGFQNDEVKGQAPWLLAGQDTDPVTLRRIMDELDESGTTREEILAYCKNGEPIWLEFTATPVIRENEDFRHWIAILRDVTERKQSAERLADSEERFRLISRASSDVIWDWDIGSGRFWLSENYEEVFQKNIDDEPQTFEASLSRIHPEDQERIRESLYEAVNGDTDSWHAEYRVATGSGKYKIIEDRAFIIRNAEGRAVRMVAGMADVTEMRMLDRRVRSSEKLEAIGQLTGGVAHDFNNLLTIILGNVDLLLEKTDDPETRKSLVSVLQAAERGAELTDGLLAFSRQQPLEPKATDVNSFIEESRSLLRQAVEEGIAIHYRLEASQAVANVDPARLQSAILNLVLNSHHAIGERGNITIETLNSTVADDQERAYSGLMPGDYIAIVVSDDGCGMSQEAISQAFEPFYSTKPLTKGSGLGLSSVHGFVNQSGGQVRIYSEVGEGTSVRMYLPILERETDLNLSAPLDREQMKSTGEQILVVEDDDGLRAHAVQQLEALGYRISAARDAAEALGVLESGENVDLLFTDVVMPGPMNGIELAMTAKAQFPELKIICTSGYVASHFDKKKRIPEGVGFLRKPYRQVELATKLRETLDGANDMPAGSA